MATKVSRNAGCIFHESNGSTIQTQDPHYQRIMNAAHTKLVSSLLACSRLSYRRCYGVQTTSGRLKTSSPTVTENFAEYWSMFGAMAGMAINLSAIYNQRPEEVSMTMSRDLCAAGTCLAIWSLKIAPTNFGLVGCHLFNVLLQLNLIRKRLEHKKNEGGIRILQPSRHREQRRGEVDPRRRHRQHDSWIVRQTSVCVWIN